MNMDKILQDMETERQAKAQIASSGKSKLVKLFCENMIAHVVISFSGYSDNGSIDDINLKNVAGEDVNNETIRKQVEEWTWTFLESTGVDWYNNEGGQGAIEFDMRTVPFVFRANVDVNFTNSTREFEAEEIVG